MSAAPISDDDFEHKLIEYDEKRRRGECVDYELASLGPEWSELREAQRVVDLLGQVLEKGEIHISETEDQTVDHRQDLRTPLSMGSIVIGGNEKTDCERDGPKEQMGRFRLVRELGRGGNGVVYLAQDSQLGRLVALKIPKIELVSNPDFRARFLREAEAAAHLEHPFVIPVLEVGEEAGQCYIVYSFCDGPTLGDWLKDRPRGLDPRTAAELMRCLASGMQHAHDRGIVHRDLKPGNIMLQPCAKNQGPIPGLDFTPRITDFGLAKRNVEGIEHTHAGTVLGTPAYMSPEQARGDTHLAGPASDIFTLGVMMYEFLTGKRPFTAMSVMEVLDKVRGDDPVPPRKIWSDVPIDLETICLKCLEKDPQRRYATCQALSDDLHRYLAGEPISIRPIGTAHRALKWIRRRPFQFATMALAAVFFLVVVPAGVLLNWSRSVSEAERLKAEFREIKATQQSVLATRLAEQARFFSLVAKVRQQIAEPTPGWTTEALDNLKEAAKLRPESANLAELRGLAAECLIAIDLIEPRRWKTEEDYAAIAYRPDGKEFAAAPQRPVVTGIAIPAGKVTLFDAATGKINRHLHVPVDWTLDVSIGRRDGPAEIVYSSDGRWLVVGNRSGMLSLYDLTQKDPQPHSWEAHKRAILDLRAHPAAPIVYSSGNEHLKAWSLEAKPKLLATFENENQGSVFFDVEKNGDAVVASPAQKKGGQKIPLALDPRTLKPLPSTRTVPWGHSGIRCVPPGLLLLGVTGGLLESFNAQNGEAIRRFVDSSDQESHAEGIASAVVHARRNVVATIAPGQQDGMLKLWNLSTGQMESKVFVGGTDSQHACAISPDGTTLAHTARNSITSYKIGGDEYHRFFGPVSAPIYSAQFVDKGRAIAVGFAEPTQADAILAFRVDDGTIAGRSKTRHVGTRLFAANPQLPGWAAPNLAPSLEIWGEDHKKPLADLPIQSNGPLQFTPDGKSLWHTQDGGILCLDAITGATRQKWKAPIDFKFSARRNVSSLGMGGKLAAVGLRDGSTFLVTTDKLQQDLAIPGDGAAITALALPANDTVLAIGNQLGTVFLHALPSGQRIQEIPTDGATVLGITMDADGDNLAVVGNPKRLRVYAKRQDQWELDFIMRFSNRIRSASLSEDGKKILLACDREHSARLLNLEKVSKALSNLGI